ncbi:MAG: class I mannose-6-phosphate isomerase [Eubacterium sp.]|nr:class I mannose-6-phosphate isomerase [Eubacterium sp.]
MLLDTNQNEVQPQLLFLNPIFKEMVWGGARMAEQFGYELPGTDTGECWGIAAHPNGDDTIRGGIYDGMKLSSLWNTHRELFGNLEGDRFPLLIKIIDAKENLSIQVHPDDARAARYENGSLGKTECWYVLDCPKDATLVVGHYAKTREELKQMIHEGRWNELIREVPIQKGDFIQIDPGTVHAITAGCMILETQQNSDITYRVYDYDRLTDGKPRELHVEQSIASILVPAKNADDSVRHLANLAQNEWHELIACPYYRVFKLNLNGSYEMNQSYPFLNVSVLNGNGSLNGQPLKKGEHLIIPAKYGKMKLEGELELVASTVNVAS